MKRFTDTEKWNDAWFMDLHPTQKVVWLYLVDNCDCAGIIEANLRLFSFMVGEQLQASEILKAMTGRVIEFKPGKWFIKPFIKFQYGIELNPENSAHLGVLKRLCEHGIECPVLIRGLKSKVGVNGSISTSDVMDLIGTTKGLSRGYQAPKDKDTDKDKDKTGDRGVGEGASEVPTLEQAIAQTMTAGIPEDFCRLVYSKWYEREGKDGSGQLVDWFRHVKGRWDREGTAWRNGSHNGKSKNGPSQQDYQIRAHKKELQDAIDTHPANSQSVYYRPDCTTEEKQFLKQMRDKLKAITQESIKGLVNGH